MYVLVQNNVDSINAKANILDLLYMLMTRKKVEQNNLFKKNEIKSTLRILLTVQTLWYYMYVGQNFIRFQCLVRYQ